MGCGTLLNLNSCFPLGWSKSHANTWLGSGVDLRQAQFTSGIDWRLGMVWRASSIPIQRRARGIVMSLCLLAVLTGSAHPVWATCGDYLHGHGGHQMAAQAGSFQLDMPSGNLVPDAKRLMPHRPLPGPTCSGPNCHRDDRSPVAPGKALELPTQGDAVRAAGWHALKLCEDI